MNHVLLVGRIEQDPESRPQSEGGDCVIRLAVRRRPPAGRSEPGVTFLEVTIPWPRSRDCSEIREGELIAVSGLIECNEWRDESGEWRSAYEIVADWVERLVGGAGRQSS